MIVYLSGKITGKDPRLVERDFGTAEEKLKGKGHIVLNPTCLPKGMPTDCYLPICMAMLDQADAVVVAGDDYEDSHGASIELSYAIYQGLNIYPTVDYVPWEVKH